MADVDTTLLGRTQYLSAQFESVAQRLRQTVDTRVFFVYAHGYITRKIGEHIDLFTKPNPLMRLNDQFATTFLAAINGAPHDGWQKAFRVCAGVDTPLKAGFVEFAMFSTGSFELCGACMAKIHIQRDLRAALNMVRDVDAQDYGNVLIFVTEGHLWAERMVRGQLAATLSMLGQVPIMDKLKMNAKVWRNQVFEEVYGTTVPEPSKSFTEAYQHAEGRT